MNKTDRLLAIVLELQRNGTMRAEDLAATFETSRRTIYRDIQALSEAGVPIVGSTGIGYSLMEGYFLPPLSFTIEEAVALLIGTDFVETKFDSRYRATAHTSQAKIEAILPEKVLDEVRRIRAITKVADPNEIRISRMEKEYLVQLRQAILQMTKVEFRYAKKSRYGEDVEPTRRRVAPYGLILINGYWVLIAACELRDAIRHFRLSRMSDLHETGEVYEVPAEFNLKDYSPADDRHLLIRVHTNVRLAEQIKESNNFYLEDIQVEERGLIVTFRVRQIEDILHWVLSWGSDVVVLEPDQLRQRVREELENTLKRY
ncbi:YafY family transcriptional regulator [Paenibacillus sp. HWE-109]|uniref:helix-turn-helix transcriptional regulator n=1 Tax=Paenibacillus sp. HWE-109 TaxID=1306526 RepID=UPI001EDF818F|nr:YafY family protein [Paenibacillus sp. HWE-109]UKS29197.1 YafY family transcriptional regulator [Paenibacillus sp. HWE-109]